MPALRDAGILIISANGFEEAERMVPRRELAAAGARVEVAAPDGQPIRGWNEKDWGDSLDADLSLSAIRRENDDALVIPGGQINAGLLRVDPDATKIIRSFFESGKVVAAICHGPWLLVEADAVRGRTVTSYKSIRTDVTNAGGNRVDREVAADQGIVTGRSPADLGAFVAKIVEDVEEGRHQRRNVA